MRNSFCFFVIQNKGQTQKASGPMVADWQYEVVDKYTRDWSRIENVRVEIGPILRTDFRAQGCYSGIDISWHIRGHRSSMQDLK